MSHKNQMNLRKKFRVCLKIVISLVCLLVCSYQVYLVGVLYLSYPTVVDVRIGRSLNIHLPAITICSEISTTIIPEKIVELQPSLYQFLHGKTQREIWYLLGKKTFRKLLEEPLQKLPINVQHKYTINANKFFDKCEVPTPLGYQKGLTYAYNKINCSAISTIVETISFERKCFTLFYSDKDYNQNNYNIKRDSAANLKFLAWIRIHRDYVLNGLLYVHSPRELHQFSDGNNVMQINPNKEQYIGLSFNRQITTLLPPPYATQCKNYSIEGFPSRDHCLAQCKIDSYTDSDGWPGDIFATNNITYTFSKLWMNSKSPSGHLEEGLSLDEKCRKRCGDYEDCQSIFYDVKQLSGIERDEEDYEEQNWFTIGILPPKSVDMTLVHLPKYEPVELAIYVGGLVSLYLGISVVSVIVTLFAFITFTDKQFDGQKKVKNNLNQKQNIEINSFKKTINSDTENNNSVSLIQSNNGKGVEDNGPQEPRSRLPGILHFMFET